MRPLAVVVVDVDAEHAFEVTAVEDQQPVETLGTYGPDEALDAADPDLFVALAGGRSALRVEDLLALAELVEDLRAAGDADAVREILP